VAAGGRHAHPPGVLAPLVVYVVRLAAALRVPWVALAERGQE
jgi:hypothetical protein